MKKIEFRVPLRAAVPQYLATVAVSILALVGLVACFNGASDNRCPGFDDSVKVLVPVRIELQPDLVDQIAEAVRQDLKDPVTIDNLQIEDAGKATLVRVNDKFVLGDPRPMPNERRDGTRFYRVIELMTEAHFEDGMNLYFRVYANVSDSEEGCIVNGVAIPPLGFIP